MAREQTQWVLEESAQQLRPTLLIGLGGSGQDVLLRIRRLFYERMGKNADGSIGYPLIGYLAIDMDPNSNKKIEGDDPKGHLMQNIRFRDSGLREFLHTPLRQEHLTKYRTGGPAQFPHIFKWLSPGTLNNVTLTGHGAGQNRQAARLAFFEHYRGTLADPGIRPTLEGHIQRILDAVRRPEQLHGWKPANAEVDANELNVVLVYSLAGGTGAGMFLDMSLLVREIILEKNLKVECQFSHYLVLPEAFMSTSPGTEGGAQLSEDEKHKIQENAYAAFREMEYLAMDQDESFDLSIPRPPANAEGDGAIGAYPPLYKVQWERSGKEYQIYDAPWHICYLVGGSNDRLVDSTVVPSDLYQMIAEFIFLDFDPNQFGNRRRMRWPNIMDRLQTTAGTLVRGSGGQLLYDHQVSRRYSTFGLAQIYFDRARMRRAASYRLAVTLLNHWMRDLGLAPDARRRYATEDILEGKSLPGEREAPVALQLEGIRDLLLLKDRKRDRRITWRSDVEEDERNLRKQIEDGETDATIIDAWIEQHKQKVERHSHGGKEGLAREGIMSNCKAVKEEIDNRLHRLFLFRISEMGLTETRLLMGEYADLLREEVLAADELTRADVSLEDLWRDRLDEASRLPNWLLLLRPARRAVQAEMLRGIRKVGTNLRQRYTFAASEEIRECLQAAADRVGRIGAKASESRGSYISLIDRFQELQKRTRDVLETQFGELRKDDRTTARTRGLLDHWDAEKYDQEIRAHLGRGQTTDRGFLEQLETRVLAQMRQQKENERPGLWENVDSLGALVLELLPLEQTTPVPNTQVEEFAHNLAAACWTLLEQFCAERSARELFDLKGDEKQTILDTLRTYSAPFLRSSQNASLADRADTNTLLQLGIQDHDSDNSKKFLKELQKNAGQDLNATRSFTAQRDAIIFCQEKHGLPLLYYQHLEEMARWYYKSGEQPKRHFDFEFLQDRLPDVRMIDFEKQKNLGTCLELTLEGIITRVLTWHDEQFHLSMSSSRYAPPRDVAQGARLENIIHRYAENEPDRRELARQVNEWIKEARQKTDGSGLALLWCSIEDLIAEVEKLADQIRQARTHRGARGQEGGSQNQHPIVSILCHETPPGLVPRLREQLAGLPDPRWLNSKIDRLYLASRYPAGAQRDRALEERERILKDCYFPEGPGGLPIRVIKPNAVLRLADVQFQDASSPTVPHNGQPVTTGG